MYNVDKDREERTLRMRASTIVHTGRGTWNQLCYLFLIFLVGCVIGWIYEEIFYWFTEGMLRNRGILYGPWLPIYGIGALGIYAVKPLRKKPLLLFFLCMAVSGVVEYLIGFVGIRYFGLRLWDYRGLFLNLDGIICFRSVVSFGILGLAFHYLLEPTAEKLYRGLRPRTVQTACAVLAALLLMDSTMSYLFRVPITY